ncbi:MAG: OsmC family protein [Verrucomicrobia bacterium]|nr:OsmC family protein [Verrucomicrobiota bacterium]MBV9671855.1 OsmC family protein [Verrucomicrobiota bacterium]
MVKIVAQYEGNLRTEATHTPSGTQLLTDAPLDNGGKAESFSPTDLVATALGTCMITTMGIFAERHGIDLRGTRVEILKEMQSQPQRRIRALNVNLYVSVPEDHPQRFALEQAALGCPVHKSLHSDVKIPVEFHWQTKVQETSGSSA